MSLYVGKEMVTRDGRKARVICVDYKNRLGKSVLAVVEGTDRLENVYAYTNKGMYATTEGGISQHDLFEPVVENALYRVIYDTGVIGKSNFLSERDARAHMGAKHILKLVFSGTGDSKEFIRAELI